MSESKDPRIAALLREREGYVRYSKPDRVKAVDAELKRLGYEEKKAEKKAEPKARSSRTEQQSTADDASRPAKKS